MGECSHNCSSCGENCSSRQAPESLLEKPHEMSRIDNVIGVVSGKGGVGKSLVSALLSCAARRRGFEVAALDADITGPSIPKAFGLNDRMQGSEFGIDEDWNFRRVDQPANGRSFSACHLARPRYRGRRETILERRHLERR